MLTLINDTQLDKVSPEELAHLLTNGNPKLVSSLAVSQFRGCIFHRL